MPNPDAWRALHLTEGKALLLNAPAGLLDALGPPPPGVRVLTRAGKGPYRYVHLFATTRAQVERLAPRVLAVCDADGAVWVSWPHPASGVETDLTHRSGWEFFDRAGWRPVEEVDIHEDWCTARLQPKPRLILTAA